MAVARRHLPIAGQRPAPEPGTVPSPTEDEDRPPWHWSGIGAVLIFVFWLPLAMVGQWVSARLVAASTPDGSQAQLDAFVSGASAGTRASLALMTVGPLALSFLIASAAGGAMVGRFGGQAGRREAAVAGLVAASTAWALTAAGPGGLSATWVLWPPLALMGTLASLGGGIFGLRLRRAR